MELQDATTSIEACHVGFSSAVQASLRYQLTTCGLMPVTPEAAGSSPVDPANYLPIGYLHGSDDHSTFGVIAGGLRAKLHHRRKALGNSAASEKLP
jgi:hypothetical protein